MGYERASRSISLVGGAPNCVAWKSARISTIRCSGRSQHSGSTTHFRDCPLVDSHGAHLACKSRASALDGARTSLGAGGRSRAHETVLDLVCRLLLEKKKT